MMYNRRAWIRIAEAFIAILIISSVLIFLFVKTIPKTDKAEEIYKIEKEILEEIANDNVMRKIVLDENVNEVRSFIRDKLPENLDLVVVICNPTDVCGLPKLREEYTSGEIYAKERIISSTLQDPDTKKLKLFVWEK